MNSLLLLQWARHLAVNNLGENRKYMPACRQKGISAGLISDAIDAARSEMPEEEAIALFNQKKDGREKIDLKDIKEKKRIFQSLLGRGFPPADLKPV